MADKTESTMVRYCGEIVDGVYCNTVLKRSAVKVNGHYEGVCPKCGRFYLNYNSCSLEPKAGLPRASQITASKNRAALVKAEMEVLRSTHTGTEEELLLLAQKNVAYDLAKKMKNKTTTASATETATPKKAATKKKSKRKSTKRKTAKRTTTSKKQTITASQEQELTAPVYGLDTVGTTDTSAGLSEQPVVSEQTVTVSKDTEQVSSAQASVPTGAKFFTGSWEKAAAAAEEFPDILEDVEFETVVLKQPEPFNPDLSDAKIDSIWTEAFVNKYNLTPAQVKELLLAESALLRVEKFVLDGINFNPDNLPEDVILGQIREKSIMSLMMCGKTSTQDAVDEARAARAKREAELQQMKEDYIIKSSVAPQGLYYNFLSGVMTDEQAEEFKKYGLISPKNLKKSPPSAERLYDIVNRKRILSSMGKPTTKEIEMETVVEYTEVWKKICSDICNKEFGEHSYWIAAGTDWCIADYVHDVIKTAFAAGLSVVPMTNLNELKTMYEKAHGYLNDLEFLANSPRAMRDSIERFTMFNAAYSAIYEGATPIFKPKGLEKPRYTWEAYMESDVVVIQLPEIGLVAGGLAILAELLRGRGISGRVTILISTISLKRLNELNAGLIPMLFGQNGIAIVASNEVGPNTYLSENTYVYYTSLEDRTIHGSVIQKKTKRIEAKNKK